MIKSEVQQAFRVYVRLFLKNIHPDMHCGFPQVQKCNAQVTGLIHDLFKFDTTTSSNSNSNYNYKSTNRYDVNFYVWNDTKTSHIKHNFNLIFNNPFDKVSGSSALELFRRAQVLVDNSVLNDLSASNNGSDIVHKNTNTKDNNVIRDTIVNSCRNLYDDDSGLDIKNLLLFFKSRPYIQIDTSSRCDSTNNLMRTMRHLQMLLPKYERTLTTLGQDPPIIIILSNEDKEPTFSNRVITLPTYSSFSGI